MAETQRRQQRDEADIQMEGQRLQADIAMNAENNLTKERLKVADLTNDQIKLQKEQQETALSLQEAAQRNLRG
jgi:hypothetical protein